MSLGPSSAATSRRDGGPVAARRGGHEGKRIRTSPRLLARAEARSWGRNNSGSRSESRRLRNPRAGFGFGDAAFVGKPQLVGPQVEVPDRDRPAPASAGRPRHRPRNCWSSLGGSGAFKNRNSVPEQPDARGPASGRRRSRRGTRCCPRARSAATVECLGRQVGLAGQDLEPRRSLGGRRAITSLGWRIGVEDDQTLVAVDDRHPAVVRAMSGNWPRPTTAGISSAAATMAVWLAGRRTSVAKPSTVGIEARGLARATGRAPGPVAGRELILERVRCAAPIRWPRIRASMSRTSAARAARCESAQPLQPGGVPFEHLADGVLGRDARSRLPARALARSVASPIIRRGPPGCRRIAGPAGSDLALRLFGLPRAASSP